MKFELCHPADQIVMIMERIYAYGMTTTSGGNISILDHNGDLWITPGGVDKGTLSRGDIVCVRADGTVEGIHKPSIELPFHQMVYRTRPDVRAVLHAHPSALVSFSIVRRIPDTRILPNAHLVCGKVGMAPYDLPGSVRLGEKIADVFAQGATAVLLENHGAVVAHEDLFRAFMAFETLDFCARIEINARRIGQPVSLSEDQLALSARKGHATLRPFTPEHRSSEELRARQQMCDLIRRAYRQRLFTSTQGTFSQRLPDGSFLITPYRVDRNYMEIEDLVLVRGDESEAGKTPSRSVLLHAQIYARQPQVNSIIIAHPPGIMAFAVTREAFDSRTIPESYVLLRNMRKIPFGDTFLKIPDVADAFSPDSPAAIVENECVVATGSSLLNAFDRLEVAEFSARGIIDARAVGSIVSIDEEQVNELNEAFHLDGKA